MKKLIAGVSAAVLVISLSATIASARGHGGHGGGLGSTANQYTGQGYWTDLGTANSSLGGQPNAMTEPVAPWLASPSVPPQWRAWETTTPSWPAASQTESKPRTPAGEVEISGAGPRDSGSSAD